MGDFLPYPLLLLSIDRDLSISWRGSLRVGVGLEIQV